VNNSILNRWSQCKIAGLYDVNTDFYAEIADGEKKRIKPEREAAICLGAGK